MHDLYSCCHGCSGHYEETNFIKDQTVHGKPSDVISYPGWCRGRGCGGGRGERGPAVGGRGRGGGTGGRGVTGPRLGAPPSGPEGGQTLRRPLREDELLPQLQVGAAPSCRETQQFVRGGSQFSSSRGRQRQQAQWGRESVLQLQTSKSVHVSFESAREGFRG